MAIKIDWKIVSDKQRKKVKKPNKKKISTSYLWKDVWWIWDKWDWFPLYEWTVTEEVADVLEVQALNRDIKMNPTKEIKNMKVAINKVTLSK